MQLMRFRAICQKNKQQLYAIPFIFTLANACCGLMSVLCALDDKLYASAVFIFIALFLDAIDGRVARALGVASSIGMELDSLCDAISFCLAPAVLFYSAYLYEQGVPGLLVTGFYLCCGLFRLARFNNAHADAMPFFIGLPTPAAALVIVMIAMHDPWIMTCRMHMLVDSPYAFMLLVLGLAVLMISNVRFPTFKCRTIDHVSASVAFVMIIVGIFAIINHYPIFLSVVIAYILGGIISYFISH